MTEWRFCKELQAKGQVYDWVAELVGKGRTFEKFVTRQIDEYTRCESTGSKNCTLSRLLATGLYDQNIARYMRAFPPTSFCFLSNVRA